MFVPFETAATLLNSLTTIQVNCVSLWHWIQKAGQKSMDRLKSQLDDLTLGHLPQMEFPGEAISILPLLMGADGVMVPFRPESGKGSTVWREQCRKHLAHRSGSPNNRE